MVFRKLRRAQVQPQPEPNIPAEHVHLWDRLRYFQFDDPEATVTFSKKLAEEQGWSREFALRVIDEYRKFLFLAMVAPHRVSPSVIVDQAWHLHLQYIESYLIDLCVYVFRRLLMHIPSKGGHSECQLYGGLYQQTLQTYEQFFGPPPEDIWGKRNKVDSNQTTGCATPDVPLDPNAFTNSGMSYLSRALQRQSR